MELSGGELEMIGCKKCQLYGQSSTEERCRLCNSEVEELTGDLMCNGGCGQVKPVYKWMAAAFDSPYPYCEECFPKNWAPMEGGMDIYSLIDQ